MNFLITGIPATGKTTIGNYLESKYNFLHLDCELYKDPEEQKNQIENFLKKEGNKVITWGFMPGEEDEKISELQRLGYKMIWFDTINRKFAESLFIKRAKEREQKYNYPFEKSMNDLRLQMVRIESMDLSKFNRSVLDTFNTNGNLLDIEIICRKIFLIDSL